ncbi:hypothetical protein SDC9_129540 [bioreactor metagenome]|uniref:YlxR domain-containing protein n=1 Tax=bioreactor metagenome TaxID=1076179 RepID=A0A645CZX9_9ZZZZ
MTEAKRKRQRTCIGCHSESPKRTLVRVVRSPDGIVTIDQSGKKPGRGAYLCLNRECIELARKKKALSRALRCEVDEKIYDELLSLILEQEL